MAGTKPGHDERGRPTEKAWMAGMKPGHDENGRSTERAWTAMTKTTDCYKVFVRAG